jgi:hypothetical protein
MGTINFMAYFGLSRKAIDKKQLFNVNVGNFRVTLCLGWSITC